MSANYSPYYTSEAAGETLNGTMVNDRASGPDVPLTYETAMGPASAVPAPSPSSAPSYDNRNLDEIQVETQRSRQAERPPFKSFTLKADGTFKAEGDQSTLADVMGQLNDLKTMKTAAMARVAQLRQQESSGSPILDALSQIAGGMAANDPTMPGWVRALGATNLAMGPQGIKRERMAEENRAMVLGKNIADLSLDAAKQQEAQYRDSLTAMMAMKKEGDKTVKDTTDAAFKIHDDAFQQITQSNAFDERGLVAKMQALDIPTDQIVAEVGSLKKFQEDRAKKLAEAEAAKDEKERRKRAQELRDMDTRNEEAMKRALTMAGVKFGQSVMTASKLPAAEETTLLDTTKALRSVANARKVLKENADKFGFGKGALLTAKAWRGSEEQKMLSASVDTLTEAAKAAGLKPLSDTDLRIIKQGIFDPNKSVAANAAVLDDLERKMQGIVTDLMEFNPQFDWASRKDALPPFTHDRLGRLSEKRRALFGAYAPPGASVPGYTEPAATKKYPWEK